MRANNLAPTAKWELCPSHFVGGAPLFLLRVPASHS